MENKKGKKVMYKVNGKSEVVTLTGHTMTSENETCVKYGFVFDNDTLDEVIRFANVEDLLPYSEYKLGEYVHPSHYCDGRKYEPKDVFYAYNLNFNLGACAKYISRAGRKNGESKEKDLRKAIDFINFELEHRRNKPTKPSICDIAEDWKLSKTLKLALTGVLMANDSLWSNMVLEGVIEDIEKEIEKL